MRLHFFAASVAAFALAATLSTAANAAPRKVARPALHAAAAPPTSMTAIGAYRWGNPAAPAQITEYFSYTCSHCAHFEAESHEPMRQKVVAGQAAVTYYNMLANAIDVTAALLARCGGAARFVGNHHALMANQQAMLTALQNLPESRAKAWDYLAPAARFQAIARDTGLMTLMQSRGYTAPQLNACLANRAELDRMMAMTNAGVAANVQATPTVFVNGTMQANHDWATLSNAIDQARRAR